MPHKRYVCVLLPLMIPCIRHVHLGLHIAVTLKGRTTHIWSFSCGFACAIAMVCARFELSFVIIIVLYLLTIIKKRQGISGLLSGFGSVLDCCLGNRSKISCVIVLNYWDTIAFISTARFPACLFV